MFFKSSNGMLTLSLFNQLDATRSVVIFWYQITSVIWTLATKYAAQVLSAIHGRYYFFTVIVLKCFLQSLATQNTLLGRPVKKIHKIALFLKILEHCDDPWFRKQLFILIEEGKELSAFFNIKKQKWDVLQEKLLYFFHDYLS